MASAEIGEPLNPEQAGDGAAGHEHDEQAEKKNSGWNLSDTFLNACRTLSIVTAVTAVLCGIVNLVSAVRSFKSGDDVFVGILRCYAVVLAFFVAIAETEWERIFKFWKALDYWVFRGMLQIFIAVMTKALSHASGESELETELHKIASWALFACGVLYIVSGILCIGKLKRSWTQKTHWREDARKELEEVEKKRKELKGLLADQV